MTSHNVKIAVSGFLEETPLDMDKIPNLAVLFYLHEMLMV